MFGREIDGHIETHIGSAPMSEQIPRHCRLFRKLQVRPPKIDQSDLLGADTTQNFNQIKIKQQKIKIGRLQALHAAASPLKKSHSKNVEMSELPVGGIPLYRLSRSLPCIPRDICRASGSGNVAKRGWD